MKQFIKNAYDWVDGNLWVAIAVFCGTIILGWLIIILWFILAAIIKKDWVEDLTQKISKIIFIIQKYALIVGVIFLVLEFILKIVNHSIS